MMHNQRLIMITILVVVVLSPLVMPMANGLYTATLPTNTLFADDFESYTQGQNLGSGSTGTNPTSGWSFYDSDTGGQRTINNTNYFSCCKSLWLLDSNANNGKFDVHKIVPISNSTRLVSVSTYIAWNTGAKVDAGNAITWSIEVLDANTKYECIGEYFPAASLIQFVGGAGVSLGKRLNAYDDTFGTYFKGTWHKVVTTCDIINHKYIAATVDNWDFSNQVNGMAMNTAGTTEGAGGNIGEQVRVEYATVNGASHTTGWWAWHDDVVVTDVTTTPTQSLFAANELWKAVAAMGSMMSVVTMYSSVRAYQEPDPLRRRMKLMVAVVFAVGAGTLAVFAIILSRL